MKLELIIHLEIPDNVYFDKYNPEEVINFLEMIMNKDNLVLTNKDNMEAIGEIIKVKDLNEI